MFPPGDFESPASTNFATRAGQKTRFLLRNAILPKDRADTIGFVFVVVKPLQLSDFDYHLPEQLIAQRPLPERMGSRLLQLNQQRLTHGSFNDLTKQLRAGDLLVLNDTRVVKARLQAVKDSGGTAEILLERVLLPGKGHVSASSARALCQVRVSKPLKAGRFLTVADNRIDCLGRQGEFYHLRFPEPVFDFLQRNGELPLPPYIQRDSESAPDERALDEERYQTVFARNLGAVAAPTATCIFPRRFWRNCRRKGWRLDMSPCTWARGRFNRCAVRICRPM